MSDVAHHILKKHWGYDTFRAGQLLIVESLINNQDTLVLLPTGGGKSICFQVPAALKSGCTLVVSPLIALMKDQVETLNKKGIPAMALHSGLSRGDVNALLERALKHEFKLIYVSPERLATQNFRGYLTNLKIEMIVVDEAHCISMWGQDFRPAYQKLVEIRALLPGIPMAAFTASAPQWIQDDIISGLSLIRPAIHRGDFSRNNLVFHCLSSHDKESHTVKIIQKSQGSALVFANTRKSVESLCKTLIQQGISASFYHAGLTNVQRSERQTQWINNDVRVMVCTNAFGMGVDKPDVRLVIHSHPPKNPEDYYQEAGRAGRDGKTSHCVLLHHPNDWIQIEQGLLQQHPNEQILAKAYHSVLNGLGIADGQGEWQTLPVNLLLIAQQYDWHPKNLYYAAKALEVLSQWQFSEGSSQSSRIMMVGRYDEVYDFKETQPQFTPLLDVLLRGYSGIFDHPVTIQESALARRIRKGNFNAEVDDAEIHQLKIMLTHLESRGLIKYLPATELPTITLTESRSLYPSLNMPLLQRLLKRRMQALDKFKSYVALDQCRSNFWKSHFTDAKVHDTCGSCDVCKRVNRWPGDEKSRLFWEGLLRNRPNENAAALLRNFPLTQRDILTQSLRILLDEGCIIENQNQQLSWVGESFSQ